MSRKEFLKNVYVDTKNKCKIGHYGRLPTGESTVYGLEENFQPSPRFESTHVDVINDDVLNVTRYYAISDNNVLVLNLASEISPGGGVTKGSMAQEEELFRRTNYFMYLPRRFYPIPETNVIVTSNVTVLKDENYQDLSDIFTVSFMAACAVRKPILPNKGTYKKEDYEIMCKTIENIFKTAYLLGYDTLILGALGCGAFGNPPKIVSRIFDRYVKIFNHCFKHIIFAVLSTRDDNFNVFRNNISI